MSETATSFQQPDVEMEGMVFIEQLRSDSALYRSYGESPYNPDEIAKKDPPFGIYDKMRTDDQIKAVLWLKKFMVLSSGWRIEVPNKEYNDIANELSMNLSEIDDPEFGDAITNMLSNLDYGFSISEPVFEVVDTDMGQRVQIKDLKPRAPHTFTLHTDKNGNLVEIEQDTMEGPIKVSPDRIIHMVHQYEFGVPYGISDLRSAYRAWFSKDIVIKFWNIYLERFGNPFIVATIPPNTSSADKSTLMTILKNIQAKTGITVPEGVTIDIKTSQTGTTDFERAVDNYNMMIARSMLIPDLIGISGPSITGGSFALGEKHFEVFFITIEKLRNDLERAINRKIIKPLIFWNYGLKGNDVPVWKLHPIDTNDRIELLRLWSDAVKGKIWDPSDEEINHFRQNLRFPTGDVKRPPPTPPSAPGGFPGAQPYGGQHTNPFGPAPQQVADHSKWFVKRSETKFEKKVNFGKINNAFDNLNKEATDTLVPVFKKIKEGLIDAVQSRRLVDNKKIAETNDLKLKFLKDLQIAWRGILRSVYNHGQESANSEIVKVKKAQRDLTPDELFAEALSERSFFITGVERDRLLAESRQIILNGIEKGLTTKEVVHQLSNLFDENYDFGSQRLETVVRTNVTKAFNQARRAQWEAPDTKDFIKGYQFSAILDSRTSDICEALDGKTYKVDDPYIDRITPPLHYNCRSMLVPITEGEEFDPSDHVVNTDDLQSFRGELK